MKLPLNISLDRQIQLAVAVFVLLPATLSYGPLAAWFEPLDLALRNIVMPTGTIADHQRPVVVDVPYYDDAPDVTTLTQLLSEMDAAASVTLTDALPNADADLVSAARYNGATYITDAVSADGKGSTAEVRAAARGIAHATTLAEARDRHRGLQAWRLSGNTMRASAALLPLVADQRWRKQSRVVIDDSNILIIPARGTRTHALSVEQATSAATPLAQRVERKHVFMGSRSNSNLGEFARMHTALASGQVLGQPRWAQSVNWLMIALGMFALVSAFWRESRRMFRIHTRAPK